MLVNGIKYKSIKQFQVSNTSSHRDVVGAKLIACLPVAIAEAHFKYQLRNKKNSSSFFIVALNSLKKKRLARGCICCAIIGLTNACFTPVPDLRSGSHADSTMPLLKLGSVCCTT